MTANITLKEYLKSFFYVLEPFNNDYISGTELSIYSESVIWNRSNPGHYTYFGESLKSFESSLGSDNE